MRLQRQPLKDTKVLPPAFLARAVKSDRCIEEFRPVVTSIARMVFRKIPPGVIELDDLIQVGMLGAFKAIKDHEQQRGSLEKYVKIRATGEMLDELRRLDPLSQRDRRIVKAVGRLAVEADSQGVTCAVAKSSGVGEATVSRALEAGRASRLVDFSVELIACTKEEAESGSRHDILRKLLEVADDLISKEKIVFALNVFYSLKQKEIAGVFSLNSARISQLIKKVRIEVKKIFDDYKAREVEILQEPIDREKFLINDIATLAALIGDEKASEVFNMILVKNGISEEDSLAILAEALEVKCRIKILARFTGPKTKSGVRLFCYKTQILDYISKNPNYTYGGLVNFLSSLEVKATKQEISGALKRWRLEVDIPYAHSRPANRRAKIDPFYLELTQLIFKGTTTAELSSFFRDQGRKSSHSNIHMTVYLFRKRLRLEGIILPHLIYNRGQRTSKR